jgi:hypothetical protein
VSGVPVTGTLTDERRLFGALQFAFDAGPFADLYLSLDGDGTHAEFSISTTHLADGPHTLTVVGWDQAGNVVQETVSFIVDTFGPVPVDFSPRGTVLDDDIRQLTVVLGEDQIVAASVTDGRNWVLEGAGGDPAFGYASVYSIPIFDEQIAYDATDRRVTITLPAPLVDDYYRLTIRGSGPAVIRDLAGFRWPRR